MKYKLLGWILFQVLVGSKIGLSFKLYLKMVTATGFKPVTG